MPNNEDALLELSDDQLRLIAPLLTPSARAQILPPLNAALKAFDINTVERVGAFLSQLLVESNGLTRFEENLNYSAPRLLQVFPKHFTPAEARTYAHQPEQIANRVYANRLGNGNEASGDGWKYRGSGGIQRTGLSNFRRFHEATGINVVDNPDMLRANRVYSFLSDALFWSDNRLNRLADCLTGKQDDNERKTLTAISKRINGGTNGLADRIRLYWRTLAILKQEPHVQRASSFLDVAIAKKTAPAAPAPEAPKSPDDAAPDNTPDTDSTADATTTTTTTTTTTDPATVVVGEQAKAASYIDLAEQVPASAIQTHTQSIWGWFGSYITEGLVWLGAILKAGSIGAWAGIALCVVLVAYVLYRNRADLKRWATLVELKTKELILGTDQSS